MCSLTNIHTIATPTIPILIRVLSQTFPDFLEARSKKLAPMPIKLLVIDALAELFHSASKTTTCTLVERSRNITQISTLLHFIANKYQIAILVLNEVADTFDRGLAIDIGDHSDLIYRDQARWFNRAHSLPGEDRKEASLGLVWANQVNARILLSRTGRRRYLNEFPSRGKHRRVATRGPDGFSPIPRVSATEDQATLIRRLSIIFTSVSLPKSLDFVVSAGGLTFLKDDNSPPEAQCSLQSHQDHSEIAHVSLLDVDCSQDGKKSEGHRRLDGLPNKEGVQYRKIVSDDALDIRKV
jgi:hypothetical protein